MKLKRWPAGILAAVAAVGLTALPVDVANGQAPPPIPALYSGSATVSGTPVPDGLLITARVADYVSEPATVMDGRYEALAVSPPDDTFAGKTVTFHLDGIQADQTDTFQSGRINLSLDLTFPMLPATPTPVPTNTPVPTPTPLVALPAVYSGFIAIAGAEVAEGSTLVARIGSYESPPALIEGDEYKNLVVDPDDFDLLGETIEFFLNGVQSKTTDIYRSGNFNRDFDLVFIGVPTPTPVPPTPTPTRTPTPLLPTPTPVSPTATPTPPPTATPTATPVTPVVPPTPTATAVIVSPEATPTPEPSGGGGCSPSLGGHTPALAGLGNMLFLLAPLALITGYRRWRR